MTETPDVLTFTTPAEWEAWLAAHHDEPGGAWLKLGRKGCRYPALALSDALDGALCYGWIDSVRRSFDENYFLQKYSPRRPRGSWSQVNVHRAEQLAAAGRIRPPGQAAIEAAKADGRWAAAYESQKDAAVPPDFQAALDANPAAAAAFGQLGKTARYTLILPLLKARTPQTRASRLTKAMESLG
ncbi:YdeI/OmpD-associated family protein [Longispora albida]|uniref:YdeI/OmpD-associated family protein n=1 Tax=Longispora albida TaxID=203523 RepID=UPI000370036E|nr:YdeI/OmpD-associated family protein [Longispora albida]